VVFDAEFRSIIAALLASLRTFSDGTGDQKTGAQMGTHPQTQQHNVLAAVELFAHNLPPHRPCSSPAAPDNSEDSLSAVLLSGVVVHQHADLIRRSKGEGGDVIADESGVGDEVCTLVFTRYQFITQFTCFTSTEVQILTPDELLHQRQQGPLQSCDALALLAADMLYLLLTCSGSEGRPKAVMLSHTNHVVQALEKIAQVR
jgi:acyl-CoA synthetase (AMP-forming)/AMP-acid ligase II